MKTFFTTLFCVFTLGAALNAFADTEPDNDSYTGADILAENDSVEGSIYTNPVGDTDDWYQLVTTSDGNITITSTCTNNAYNGIYLYDSDGTTQLGYTYNFGGTSKTYVGLAAGTYFVRYYYYSSNYSSEYKIYNTVTPSGTPIDEESNDSPAQALAMGEGATVEGHIGYRYNGGSYDTDDYYVFTTSEDGSITLTLSNAVNAYNGIYLYDSDGTTQLGSGFNYGGTSITVNGLTAGTYYARVYWYSSQYYSGYTLSNSVTPADYENDEEPNDNVASALPMSEGGTVSGHIGFRYNGGTYDSDDWYQFTTTTDGNVSLTLSNQVNQYNCIYMYGSDGTILLVSGCNYGGTTITKNGLAAGVYYARVYFYDASRYCGYQLSNSVAPAQFANDAEPNDSYTEANAMAENDSVVGHIGFRLSDGSYDTDDWYSFTTSSDGNISLILTNYTGQYNCVYLYDNDGVTLLVSGCGYGGTTITKNGLTAGTYYAKVNYYDASRYSGYSLKNLVVPTQYDNDPEPNDDFASSTPMLTNSTSYGHIGHRNNGGTFDTDDYYVFTTHSAGDLTLTLANQTNQYNCLYIYDSNQIQLSGGGCNYGGTTITKTDLPAGTYYVRVYYYDANRYSGYTLTNNFCPDAITIVAEGETIICEGDYVTLSTPDHHLSYLWSTGATTSTINALLSDDYSLTIDDGNGCVRTSNTITVDVTPAPSATIIADGPTTFCEGGSVNLSVNFDADSYLWSTGETTPSITVSEGGEYQVTLTKNGCTGESQPILITVNAVPNATIVAQGPTTFCDGGSVMLKAPNGNDSYLWSTGETTSSISAVASGDYSCVVTDNGCSATSNTISVTETPIPSVSIEADGPTEFCSGESVNLNASGADSYLWSTGATTASINVTASGEYSVTGTTSGCSGVSNTITVTVTPCGSVTISADGATEFCDGGSVTLTSSEASGNVWSTGETTQSIVVTGSGDYYVTNGNNTSNTISVVVNPLPVPVIAADGATEFCDGGSVGLHTEGTYESYLWSNGETGSGITAAQNGNYSVTVTDGNGCAGSSNTIHVTVNPNPVAEIFTDDPTTFCTHMSARLIASSNGSVQWYQDGEPVGGGLNYLRVGREGSYWVVSTLGACTTTSNSIDITLLGTWVSAQPKGPKNLCEADGETVILKANPGNPSASIRWRRDGSLIAGATGQYYTATKAGNYEAIASLDGCNTPSNTVVIKNVCKDGSAMSELMSDVTLYPNPSTDYVNISMQTAQSGQVLLRLYDASGRMVQSEKFGVSAGANSYELRFAGEQAGVFMVQLILPDGSVMNRTIIRVGK